MPAEVYYGRRQPILRRRERQKTRTQAQRFRYDRAAAIRGTRTHRRALGSAEPCGIPRVLTTDTPALIKRDRELELGRRRKAHACIWHRRKRATLGPVCGSR